MTTSKKFNKGDAVVMVGLWDRKAAVFTQRLTVGSCGKKQMHLLKEDGTLGYRLAADGVSCRTFDHNTGEYFASSFVVLASEFTDEMAQSLAVKAHAAERAHLNDCLTRYGSEGAYGASIRASIAELDATAPRVLVHP